MCGVLKKGCPVHKLAWLLVLIGALNWGLVGLFGLNLVELVFGSIAWLERLVYVLVGLSAVLALVGCPCKKCKAEHGACKCGPGMGDMKADMGKEKKM